MDNNDKRLDELQKEINALRDRVENLKRELPLRDNAFVIHSDDHIPIDHYW